MELTKAVQLFAVIHLTTIGLSHIVAHRAWAELFILLRSHGHAGVFLVALLSLGFGSVIAAFHSVWSGLPLILTLYGWGQVAKGLLYLTFPSVGLKSLERVSVARSAQFMFAGVALVLLGIFVGWMFLFR